MDKKATVYVIDCSASIAKSFGEVKKVVRNELASLVIWGRKTDQAGVLAWNGSGHPVHELQAPTKESILIAMRSIPTVSGAEIDVTCGIIAAMDMITKHCRNLKYVRTVKIYASAASLYQLSSEAELHSLRDSAAGLGIFLDFILVGDVPANAPDIGLSSYFDTAPFTPLDQLQDKPKSTRPVPVYRGSLTLGHPDNERSLAWSVTLFPATRKARPPTASKYFGSSHAAISTVSESVVDNKPIPSVGKGYLYGSEVIPVSDEIEKALRHNPFTDENRFEIIAFVPAVPPYALLGEADYVIPGSDEAILGLGSLAETLFERDQGAIARLATTSTRKSDLGLLYLEPYITPQLRSFLAKQLPFDEDARWPSFRNLNTLTEEQTPPPAMLKVFEDLIDEMTNEEYPLDMMEINNPYIARVHTYIKQGGLDNDFSIPHATGVELVREPPHSLQAVLDDAAKLLDIQKVQVIKPERSEREDTYIAEDRELDLDDLLS